MTEVIATGDFDNLRSQHVRFLEEAAKLGRLRVLLWDDAALPAATGRSPKFPLAERLYLLQAIRYIDEVTVLGEPFAEDALPEGVAASTWAVDAAGDTQARRDWCRAHGIAYRVLGPSELEGFPPSSDRIVLNPGRNRVIVTGCYDWLHSGHVRFFEEASQLGDLYVAVGHDANVRSLKGAGHPLFGQDERRYMVGSIRFVTQALLTSGDGWMDAEPEIALLQPHIYAVNEDGDKPEKRAFCETHGIEYVVLRRTPKEGLPRRESTVLRGF